MFRRRTSTTRALGCFALLFVALVACDTAAQDAPYPQAVFDKAIADFAAGRLHEAASEFDRLAELVPSAAPQLWQRGIALYYVGRYDDCRLQLESHRTVNPNDAENAAWHFLCVAAGESLEQAQQDLLPVGPDRRSPMAEIYEMFRGELTPDDVLAAAGSQLTARFYAHLYIGLYHQAQENLAAATEHIAAAAQQEFAASGGYMHVVARIHEESLVSNQAAESSEMPSRSNEVMTPRPGIDATNVFYYYADVEAAWRFYTEVLGLQTVADYGFAKILRVASSSYLTLVDAERGMHSVEEPKSVTLALVTDELEGWYDYLIEAEVPMRAAFEPASSLPHQGFVAIDPEGYFLEFERFEPHAENERLLPALAALRPVFPDPDTQTERPANLSIRATVLWLYFNDTARANQFYTDLLGQAPIVDQGWAWAYQAAGSGLIGIVDGSRGLHQATNEKGVTVSLFVDDVEAWFAVAPGVRGFELRTQEITDESGRVSVFVGYDPRARFSSGTRFSTSRATKSSSDCCAETTPRSDPSEPSGVTDVTRTTSISCVPPAYGDTLGDASTHLTRGEPHGIENRARHTRGHHRRRPAAATPRRRRRLVERHRDVRRDRPSARPAQEHRARVRRVLWRRPC